MEKNYATECYIQDTFWTVSAEKTSINRHDDGDDDDDDDDDDKDEWMTIGSCKKDHLRRCIRLINATWS